MTKLFARLIVLAAVGPFALCFVGCSNEPADPSPAISVSEEPGTSEPDAADASVGETMAEDSPKSDIENKVASTNGTTTNDESTEEVAAKKSSKPSLYSPEAFRDAALNGKLRVVEVCLKDELDVNEADPNGFTALAMAAYNGHTKVVKLLIENGATVDSRDAEGKTPLIHASSGPFAETASVLLKAGAEIIAIDTGEGFTPLMTAAALGNVEVVKVLLKAGADKKLTDVDEESAEDFARKEGHTAIVKLLEGK